METDRALLRLAVRLKGQCQDVMFATENTKLTEKSSYLFLSVFSVISVVKKKDNI